MKNLKKVVSLLLILTILFGVTACGKNQPAGNTTTTTQESVDDEPLWDVFEEVEQTSATETTTTTTTTTTQPQREENTNKTTTTTTQKAENSTNVQTVSVVKTELTYSGKKQIVYYPDSLKNSSKTYPAIVWANGTMCPPSMYDGLLTAIAEGGYIVVANEETMAADGNAQIQSIDFIIGENENSSSVFYKKVNTEKIGVAGHSQGGRSSVNAAAKDTRIDCVLSLAGSNYQEEAKLLKAPTLFIAGTSDMIVDAGMWIKPAYEVCQGEAVYASLKGATHTRCCTNPADYSGYAVLWFDAWLKNDKSAMSTFKAGGALSQDTAWQDFACKGI